MGTHRCGQDSGDKLAGRLRFGGNDAEVLADLGVQESRLADVGATRQSDVAATVGLGRLCVVHALQVLSRARHYLGRGARASGESCGAKTEPLATRSTAGPGGVGRGPGRLAKAGKRRWRWERRGQTPAYYGGRCGATEGWRRGERKTPRAPGAAASSDLDPAATYSPTSSRPQYHRRRGA